MNREESLKRSEEAIEELIRALEGGQSETLVRYLSMLSRFHRYSFGNCLLIAFQRPDASHVAGFHRWKELGRHVKKGETGIAILAPVIYRQKKDSKEEATKEADEVDEGDRKSTRPVGFRVVHVFDVSQTEGKELPEFESVTGDPGELLSRLDSLVRERGIELRFEPLSSGTKGISKGGEIVIDSGLSPAETFSTLVHELAHELLHKKERRKETTETVRETEAEAVAFVVSHAVGLKALTQAADYIQLYSGDKTVLPESLDRIQETASSILTELERSRIPKEACHAA